MPPKKQRRAGSRKPPRARLHAYRHAGGPTGVVAYATGRDYIVVRFRSGDTYLYTTASAGRATIAAMKAHAARGQGLSSYISQHPAARRGYARKLRAHEPVAQ